MHVNSATTGATRKQAKSSDRFKVLLVCSVDKVPQRKHVRHKWTVLNFNLSGMTTLKANKNAGNINTVKNIGLSFSCSFIIEVCSLKPVVRTRNNTWLIVFGTNITDQSLEVFRSVNFRVLEKGSFTKCI